MPVNIDVLIQLLLLIFWRLLFEFAELCDELGGVVESVATPNRFAVKKNDECRHGLNFELRGNVAMLVNVDF